MIMFEDDEKKTAETETETEEKETPDDDSAEEEDVEETEEEGDTEEEPDDSEEEDKTPKNFMDPNEVKPELRGHFKKMVAVFTRQMQGISGVKKKAAALDRLMTHPAFQDFLRNYQEGKPLNKNGARNRAEDDEDDDSEEDDEKPLTRSELRRMIREESKGAIDPIIREREDNEMRKEAKAFKAANPDWELYKDQMLELIDRNPNLSYKQAYRLAKEDDDEVDNEKERILAKKRAKIRKPSPTGGKEPVKKGKMSFIEAAQQASKKLGIKWDQSGD